MIVELNSGQFYEYDMLQGATVRASLSVNM